MIVADANVIACFWIRGPQTEVAKEVFKKDPHWLMPRLWRSELRNILAQYVTARMLSEQGILAIMQSAEHTHALSDRDVDSDSVLRLAVKSGCTAYDSEYVALAEAQNLKLVTEDREVLRKFPGRAISMKNFVNEES